MSNSQNKVKFCDMAYFEKWLMILEVVQLNGFKIFKQEIYK